MMSPEHLGQEGIVERDILVLSGLKLSRSQSRISAFPTTTYDRNICAVQGMKQGMMGLMSARKKMK